MQDPMDGKSLSPEIYDLFDKYVHSKIDRRDFVERLSMYAVGGLTVPAILDYLLPKYAETQQVAPSDPRLKSE
ncbi:MAG: dienelactone hydrolase family protein, partial [Saprospiraceae bacterium]|nr:dienelactone hydrolase family protein [Saprospiraceae bacterium]